MSAEKIIKTVKRKAPADFDYQGFEIEIQKESQRRKPIFTDAHKEEEGEWLEHAKSWPRIGAKEEEMKTLMRNHVEDHWKEEWKLLAVALIDSLQYRGCARRSDIDYLLILSNEFDKNCTDRRQVFVLIPSDQSISWRFLVDGKSSEIGKASEISETVELKYKLDIKNLHQSRNHLCPNLPFNLFYSLFRETLP